MANVTSLTHLEGANEDIFREYKGQTEDCGLMPGHGNFGPSFCLLVLSLKRFHFLPSSNLIPS